MDNIVNRVIAHGQFPATSKPCSGLQRPGQVPVKAETQDWREVPGRNQDSDEKFTRLTGGKYSTSALDWPGRSIKEKEIKTMSETGSLTSQDKIEILKIAKELVLGPLTYPEKNISSVYIELRDLVQGHAGEVSEAETTEEVAAEILKLVDRIKEREGFF